MTMFHRRRRNMPSLNTTSTADISFMLLVFFLVITSMDADKGMVRQLPPLDTRDERVTDVNSSNVLQIAVGANGIVTIDSMATPAGEVKARVMDFVRRSPNRKAHVIALSASREARYNDYFTVQNNIVAGYNALRDEAARKAYNKPFAQCPPAWQERLRASYPQRIAEIYSDGQQKGGGR